MINFSNAKLLCTAANLKQWPQSNASEIIFVGRSNAGKSTLINGLVNHKNLAYSGKTPGKTKLLNFFYINQDLVFTDAPGYGYASRNVASATEFSNLIDPYFELRNQLIAMVLVLDTRREPSDDDITMLEYAKAKHLAIIIACTKCDKLSKNQLNNQIFKISKSFNIPKDNFYPVSAIKRVGLNDIWNEIERIMGHTT